MSKEENKVFVITSGQYSDYHIDRVFSTRRQANDYLDTKDDSYRLEVYDMDEPYESKTKLYCITFRFDCKKVMDVSICCVKQKKDLIHVRRTIYGESVLDIFIESDSRKRALKVASERYGAIIAGEQTMYPYLRVGLIPTYRTKTESAYFDFNTGELVLLGDQVQPKDLPSFIKVKRKKL